MQSRFKSKAAWLAVFALIGFILGNYGLYDKIGLTSDTYKVLIDLILAVATAFGIFNNPTNREKF